MTSYKTFETVLAEALEDDAIRADWESTSAARRLSIALINYRAAHGWSQQQMAEWLGLALTVLEALEAGDVPRSLEDRIDLDGSCRALEASNGERIAWEDLRDDAARPSV